MRLFGHKPGSAALHGMIAALPQDADFDPGISIGKQLLHYARLQGISRSQANSAVAESLAVVQMSDSRHATADELSHGMRKRVSIAQTLLGKPKLIMLDEPTAGLDPPNAKIIRDVIRQQADDITFIVSSHNLDELERLCSRVVFLEKGVLQANKAIAADEDDSSYLSIRLIDVESEAFVAACAELPGVEEVREQQGAFQIRFDSRQHPALDIRLLEMISTRGWQYRNFNRGRTLEDKLFGSDSAPPGSS